jgi:hypothetical protein
MKCVGGFGLTAPTRSDGGLRLSVDGAALNLVLSALGKYVSQESSPPPLKPDWSGLEVINFRRLDFSKWVDERPGRTIFLKLFLLYGLSESCNAPLQLLYDFFLELKIRPDP